MKYRTPLRILVLAGLAQAACGRAPPQTPPASPPGVPAPEPEAPAAPSSPAWVVSAEQAGPVRYGWSVAQLNHAIGEQLRPTYEISDECDYLRPASFPAGVSLMVLKDTVVRVDVDSAGILTTEGAGVGDSETRVRALYAGRVTVEPHKYTGPEGHYLVVRVPGDTLTRIIFETDGQHVISYRAGRRPGVEYVEGCS